VQQLVIEFSEPSAASGGFDRLLELASAGEIAIADLEFVHSIAGVASTVAADRVDPRLAALDGAASGLISRHDLDAVAAELPHGHTAAVLVYRGGALDAAVQAWTDGGSTVRTLPTR